MHTLPLVSRVNAESPGGSLPEGYSLLKMDASTAIVEAIKQAEDGDGLVVRVFDSHGTHGRVGFSFADSPDQVEETDLLEEQPNPLDLASGVSLRFSPYEIKTLRLSFRRA